MSRLKSWALWLSFIAAALLACGIDWQTMTSWQLVWEALLDFINNPAQIILFCVTLFGIINNPTNKSGL